MNQILRNIQERLTTIEALKYVDEDWGQIDYYEHHPPVKWPCVLFDIHEVEYTNLGYYHLKTPRNRQKGVFEVRFTLANVKLSNTSGRAPETQRNNAWNAHSLLQLIHDKLHGFIPGENAGRMMRTRMMRIKRDDGIQQYDISYKFEVSDL